MGYSVKAAQLALNQLVGVRIPVPQFFYFLTYHLSFFIPFPSLLNRFVVKNVGRLLLVRSVPFKAFRSYFWVSLRVPLTADNNSLGSTNEINKKRLPRRIARKSFLILRADHSRRRLVRTLQRVRRRRRSTRRRVPPRDRTILRRQRFQRTCRSSTRKRQARIRSRLQGCRSKRKRTA